MSASLWLSRTGAVVLAGTLSVGALSAPAQAATTGVASVSGTQVVFKAGSGAVNRVVLTRSGNTVTVDDRVAVKAGKGCKKIKGDKTRVRCTTAKAPTRVSVTLGARNDAVVNRSGLAMSASGGTGKDSLTGGPRADRLYGGSGNDALSGGAGDDFLAGGLGNDREWGGAGHDTFGQEIDLTGADADLLSGGAGQDLADYSGRSKPVTADSDSGSRDDGRSGEGDTLTGIDAIWGGTGNDRLYGTERADHLQGGPGNDTLAGRGGNDELVDHGGVNRLDGGAGTDTCVGQSRDTLIGCE